MIKLPDHKLYFTVVICNRIYVNWMCFLAVNVAYVYCQLTHKWHPYPFCGHLGRVPWHGCRWAHDCFGDGTLDDYDSCGGKGEPTVVEIGGLPNGDRTLKRALIPSQDIHGTPHRHTENKVNFTHIIISCESKEKQSYLQKNILFIKQKSIYIAAHFFPFCHINSQERH